MHDPDFNKKIDLMHYVLFGDKETNVKGMVEKVDDIYNMFTKITNGVSLIGWFFGAVIVLGLFLGTVKGWIVAAMHNLIKQ